MLNELNAVIVGSGLFDFVDGLVDDTRSTVTSLVVLVGIIVAIIFGIKGRGVGGSIMGIAIGALIASLPFIVPAVGEFFQTEVEEPGASAETVVTEVQTPGQN